MTKSGLRVFGFCPAGSASKVDLTSGVNYMLLSLNGILDAAYDCRVCDSRRFNCSLYDELLSRSKRFSGRNLLNLHIHDNNQERRRFTVMDRSVGRSRVLS